MDNIIEAKEVQIERKDFYVEFRENDRGRFLRITEEAHGRRNTIIVPSTATNEFTAAIEDVLGATEHAPALDSLRFDLTHRVQRLCALTHRVGELLCRARSPISSFMARKSSASRRAATKPASGRRNKRKPAAKHKAAKCVYYFGEGKADGNGKMKPLLGGKGANLDEMTRIGLPVPPGFTISTEVCTYFYAHNRSYPRTMQAQVEEGIRRMG